MRGELIRCIKTGQIKPTPPEKYARVNVPKITPAGRAPSKKG